MQDKWTTDALKEYIDALLKAEAERAKVLADNFEKRMDNTNEWRAVIERLLDTYVSKSTLYSTMLASIAIAGLAIQYFGGR